MKHLYLRGLAAALSVAASSWLGAEAQAQSRAATPFFRDDATAARSALGAALSHSRPLALDVAGLQTALASAPDESRRGATPLTLALPLPDGTTGRFAVVESAVMAPALAAQFPQIKTYRGVGLDDPAATVRLDLTPQGFHAQILSPTTGTVYIDPTTRGDQQHALSFYRRDMNRAAVGAVPVCQFQPTAAEQAESRRLLTAAGTGQRTQISAAPTLRTYRLAVAATGEYTTFQGGTVALAQAAIVTTVNRVVGVYEKELAVRLVLIGNNNLLTYTNATTDPYTNGNPNSMIGENQTNVDAVIGTANYDIGHVFGTNSGGLAGLRVVCVAGNKARGVTGSGAPVGDAFDIDYVAHEMGHQFGGNHTFNSPSSSCNGNGSSTTAWEPGSGSTIMAYAGICSPDNLQNNSDAYFHSGSFQEMSTFIASTACGTSTATGNTAPTVTAPAAKTIPISTPFRLTASATDAEGDALTYNWEEMDLGPFATLTAAQVANSNVPLFRSFTATSSPTRYFPRLSDILSNTSTNNERLPTVTRTLTFRCTARDQHNGSAGVVGGVNYSSNVALAVTSAAGPFLVTAPNTAVSWTGGTTQTVTWNVAGTDGNGVNCATVNILLSTDGGLTYPTVLVSGTTNDGTHTITVPSVTTSTARIMVAAADNYFFDVSNANFSITAGATCNAPTGLSVGSITQTTASVSFTASGSATSYTVTTLPASTTQNVTASPVSLTGLTPGTNYTVSIQSNCAGGATSTAATTTFTTTAPPPCNAPTGVTAGSITATSASVSFTPNGTSSSYTVTTSPATTTQNVTASPISLTGLTAGTSYTVNIVGNCANGVTSAPGTVTFATSIPNDNCATAIGLTSAVSCTTTNGTVTGATQSQPASTCSGFASSSALDVWYSFVATGPQHTITANAPFDAVLQVFSGNCGSLTSLNCVDATSSGAETLTFTNLTGGTRYYVRYYPYIDAGGSAPANGAFTICVTGPVAPTPTATPVVVTPANGSLTNNTTPVYSGTAPASSTVTVYVNSSSIGTATTDAAGNWSLTQPTTLADGVQQVYATAQSSGLLVSANSNTNTFTVDATPPPAPVAATPANGSSINTTTPTYTGTAEANATVTVIVDGSSIGTTTANASGNWTKAQPVALAQGSHTVKARATDAAGNTGVDSNTNTFTVDITAPTVAISSSAGASGGSTTTSPIPFTITFSESVTGFVVGEVTVTNGSVGSFSGSGTTYTFNVTPSGAGTVTVNVAANVAQDAAGNGNTAATQFTITYTLLTAPDLTISTGTSASPVSVAAGTYNSITVTGTGFAQLGGAVVVNSAVTVQTGGALNTACQSLSGSGSFTLQAGATLYICNAAGITSSGASGAVQLTGPRSFSPDADYVYNGSGAQVTGNGLPAQVRNLTSTNTATLTLSQPVAIRQVLTLNNGNLATSSQALTLLSDASGTALIANLGAGTVSGAVTVQRYIDGALNPGLGYRHLAAPVFNATVASFGSGGTTPVVNPAYNTAPNPGQTVPFPTVFYYDQSRLASSPATTLSAFDKGWTSPSSLSEAAQLAFQGFTVQLPGASTLSFTGTVGNSNGTIPLSRNSGATAADAGWNLVGNPYPAPLDFSSIPAGQRTNMDAAFYTFESTSQYGGQYRSYVNGVGNPLIGTAQAFFVRVSAGQTAGSLTLNNANRGTTYNQQVPVRRDTRPLLQLRLQPTTTGSQMTDDLYVYFEQGASDAFDSQFDAEKLPNTSGLNLSTSLSATQRLSIDGRAPLGSTQKVIPLAVGVPTPGTYTLNAAQLLNLSTVPTYLRDLQTGSLIDLAQQPTYQFTVTNASALITTRFELVFSPQRPTATAAAQQLQLSVWPNPAADQATLHVSLNKVVTTGSLTLRDVLGRTVAEQRFSGSATTLPTTGLAKGTYLLTVQAPGLAPATHRVVVE